jgi:Arc-like DNA binding domain
MPDRNPYPSELADKFILRLPDGMRDRIAAASKLNKRSMNAEIVERIEKSFAENPPVVAVSPAEFAKELAASLRREQSFAEPQLPQGRAFISKADVLNMIHAIYARASAGAQSVLEKRMIESLMRGAEETATEAPQMEAERAKLDAPRK